MFCARTNHFVRFNEDSTVGMCGHMVDAPKFASWQDMSSSSWRQDIITCMEKNQWPVECRRCKQTELTDGHSIRLDSNRKHQILSNIRHDYLILGGVLDNICNSACQSCNAGLSTKIGSLSGKDYPRLDNGNLFEKIPMDRVIEIDLNGGEPTASPNYQKLLENLPGTVKIIRVNTNGTRLLPNLRRILDREIQVVITLSLDGTGLVHDYVRWPILWSNYQQTVDAYKDLSGLYPNLKLQAWTTLHALNIADWDNIKSFAQSKMLDHSWAFLERPEALNVKYKNSFTMEHTYVAPDIVATEQCNQTIIEEFIAIQDRLRRINIKDYL